MHTAVLPSPSLDISLCHAMDYVLMDLLPKNIMLLLSPLLCPAEIRSPMASYCTNGFVKINGDGSIGAGHPDFGHLHFLKLIRKR